MLIKPFFRKKRELYGPRISFDKIYGAIGIVWNGYRYSIIWRSNL